MTRWIRFEHEDRAQFGTLDADVIRVDEGDVMACGRSVGAGSMKPGSDVVVSIEGIGELSNRRE